ncbi:thiamine biosynthesis protein ThiF [Mucilaginibacter sp. PPCGB 2223]|uniref:HesA/MoeB/ThiF family protein n=1 Tax=Mucilaginibacter sp. PPCGB 2223 TaxID=1886027 RepID=UPI0008267808|nr:HesA/MoeB/ThiF family protein [Mucilaginibacter sp. PPCGB 2223]OCX50426.1 thiamine biosynthesis protein ThiF [Mucilaginibacter sp. PPCGB 2223]
MLEREELKRYNRQIILPELGLPGQEKLKAARLLVIGAGGLGCPVLQYLVAAGAGTIGIVDDDVVDISNLHRQILYSAADIGRPKALVAGQKLNQLNPFVEIIAYTERITAANAQQLITTFDVVIDGSDNFKTRYLVNDTCTALNKPLVFGSIFKFEGQVSVFNYQGGPNYRDVFPEAPPENEVPNCAEIGVIGVLPGMIGTYMANEAIKLICGIGELLSGKLLTLNALDSSITVFRISARPSQNTLTTAIPLPVASFEVADEISAETLKQWLATKPCDIYLVDVREPYEFDDENIGGVNISLYELEEHANSFPSDKKLVFICQTGQRSKIAVQQIRTLLRREAFSLKGGIHAFNF